MYIENSSELFNLLGIQNFSLAAKIVLNEPYQVTKEVTSHPNYINFLKYACKIADINLLDILISYNPHIVYHPNYINLLKYACKIGDISLLDFFINHIPEIVSHDDYISCLNVAVHNNNPKLVNYLITRNPNITYHPSYISLFTLSVELGNIDLVITFINHYPYIRSHPSYLDCISYACQHNQTSILTYLIYINSELLDNFLYMQLLETACQYNNTDIMITLINFNPQLLDSISNNISKYENTSTKFLELLRKSYTEFKKLLTVESPLTLLHTKTVDLYIEELKISLITYVHGSKLMEIEDCLDKFKKSSILDIQKSGPEKLLEIYRGMNRINEAITNPSISILLHSIDTSHSRNIWNIDNVFNNESIKNPYEIEVGKLLINLYGINSPEKPYSILFGI